MGKAQAAKILKLLDMALKTGAPVVALLDSAGVRIDEGAAAAVRASKAASILAVGVTAVEGDFERDDIVRILSPEGAPLGVGRISCDSATARRNLGRKGLKPLIHCDYLYLE